MNEKVIYEDVEELYKENMVKNCVFAINSAAHHESDTFFHWHHALEITLLLEGTMSYTVNGSNHTVTAGDLFLINSGDVHRTQNASDVDGIKALIVIIADSILDYNIHNYKDSYFQLDPRTDSYRKIKLLMKRIVHELQERDSYNYLMIQGINLEMIYYLCQYCNVPQKKSVEKNNCSRMIMKYVSEHYDEKITLDSIAEVAGYQSNYFTRCFKKETGITFKQYLNTKRLEIALSFIEEGYSVLDAALMAGFTSDKMLIRWCRKIYQTTPLNYIKEKAASGRTISISTGSKNFE